MVNWAIIYITKHGGMKMRLYIFCLIVSALFLVGMVGWVKDLKVAMPIQKKLERCEQYHIQQSQKMR